MPQKLLTFNGIALSLTAKKHSKGYEMPIYEYLCTNCKCEFEILKLSLQDPEPQCPTCCSQEVQRLMSAGAVRPEGIPKGKGGFNPPKCKPSGG